MKLQRDLREFIELLNSHGVDYLIVGGYAVAFHGLPRVTGDIDVFIETSPTNAQKMEAVVRSFGFDQAGPTADDFRKPDAVVQLGVPPNRIDIVTGLTGVDFTEAWASRIGAELDGVAVHFISKELLIRNKKATGRPRDLADIDAIASQA